MYRLQTIHPAELPVQAQQGQVVRYPAWALNLAATALFIAVAPILVLITWRLQALSTHGLSLPLTLPDLLVVLIAALVTTIIHESIHATVFRAYGYRVSFGVAWRLLAVYTATFRQFSRRDHALISSLAPLIVITVGMLPLLAVENRYVVMFAFGALLTNTTGAVGDLYLAWLLHRLPRQAILYDVDPAHMIIINDPNEILAL